MKSNQGRGAPNKEGLSRGFRGAEDPKDGHVENRHLSLSHPGPPLSSGDGTTVYDGEESTGYWQKRGSCGMISCDIFEPMDADTPPTGSRILPRVTKGGFARFPGRDSRKVMRGRVCDAISSTANLRMNQIGAGGLVGQRDALSICALEPIFISRFPPWRSERSVCTVQKLLLSSKTEEPKIPTSPREERDPDRHLGRFGRAHHLSIVGCHSHTTSLLVNHHSLVCVNIVVLMTSSTEGSRGGR